MDQQVILLIIVAFVFLNVINCGKETFLNPNPYDNLETTHYRQMYANKMTARNPIPGPGYFKDYPGYYSDPEKLKSFYLGYSITGQPYNDMQFKQVDSQKIVDIKQLDQPFYYPEWYQYKPAPKQSHYIGYPFYFHGKQYGPFSSSMIL